MNISPIELLLLLGLGYVMYKVNKLERMLDGGASARRRPVRTPEGDGKVIPILKEKIEPGPFSPGRE